MFIICLLKVLCPKSELNRDHKSHEHFDPVDDFDIDDFVQGLKTFVYMKDQIGSLKYMKDQIGSVLLF